MTMPTHYMVVDSDDESVLAWFPYGEPNAKARAERMARDTKHTFAVGAHVAGEGMVATWKRSHPEDDAWLAG